MNRIWFLCLLLLTGCLADRTSSGIDQPIIHELSLVKQKQRIAHLQKKLALAEKEQKKAEEEVSRLEEEVHEAELSLIRKQVANIEEQIRKLKNDPQKNMHLMQIEASSLFLKEREMLHQMIQTGPSPSAFEAQVVLDQILRVITDLSNRY